MLPPWKGGGAVTQLQGGSIMFIFQPVVLLFSVQIRTAAVRILCVPVSCFSFLCIAASECVCGLRFPVVWRLL